MNVNKNILYPGEGVKIMFSSIHSMQSESIKTHFLTRAVNDNYLHRVLWQVHYTGDTRKDYVLIQQHYS